MPRAAIPAPLKTARALARTGVRVTVELDGARWTIEPVDDKAAKEVASPIKTGGNVCDDIMRQMASD
jgi:hypothetical protein